MHATKAGAVRLTRRSIVAALDGAEAVVLPDTRLSDHKQQGLQGRDSEKNGLGVHSLATPQWSRLVSNVPDANSPPSLFPAAVAVPVLCLCLRSPETVSAELPRWEQIRGTSSASLKIN